MGIPGIGAVSYDTAKGLRARFLTSRKFDRILDTVEKFGLTADTKKNVDSVSVNGLLKTMGLNNAQIKPEHRFTWFQAHGAFQVYDDTSKNVVVEAIRHIKNPLQAILINLKSFAQRLKS